MEALTEVESQVIEVEDIGEVENEPCLVGSLVKHTKWKPSLVIKAMNKAWKPKHGMSSRVLEESKLIVFHFSDAIERDWVLKNQPWLYRGYLFAVKKFTRGNEHLQPSSVDHASFWARLYDVPISCMNETSLRLFAKQIGTLESVDASDEDSIGKFVRIKISINITKPLMRGITIRAKGKRLWLPLKYESLPIYCLSCGTIGHEQKRCQSISRNLIKYDGCKLRASSKGRTKVGDREETPTTLPHDVVEQILLHLPVKYLIRFKLVCKQWEATISNPRFAENHLQQYKKSSSRNLIARKEYQEYKGLHVAELQNDRFHYLSAIEHSNEYSSGDNNILCYCDGLYLIRKTLDKIKMYVLWNPSCRTYRKIHCPQPINDTSHRRALYGIYYNPLIKDYKVVIADSAHYAVFSCRSNEWSEVQKVEGIPRSGSADCEGVSCNGYLYWPLTHRRGRRGPFVDFDIICFDWKDEKFKTIARPEFDGESVHMFDLTCSGSHICLSHNSFGVMRILKKVEGDNGKESWMEFKVQLPADYGGPFPVCWLSDDEILLDVPRSPIFKLYSLSKNKFVSILKYRYCALTFDYPFPYLENLFLQ